MQRKLRQAPKDPAFPGYTAFSLVEETESFLVYRALAPDNQQILIKIPASLRPPLSIVRQLEHEFDIAHELNGEFAVRPLKIERNTDKIALILEDCSYPPLTEFLTAPLETGHFLGMAAGIAAALAEVHSQGLVHKDIRPANFFAAPGGGIKLTGFGMASRLSREHQSLSSPEVIAGTLAYMAPEQTGRMNRSVDSRADLYALGVTFYQMLTGRLPFTASDPMEWVHCHIALQPTPPCQLVEAIPEVLSAIVMKLMAKTAEERYQTAEGLKADLERCAGEWLAHGRIEPFPLGARDVPDHLLIPEKLYGREREVETLLAAIDRAGVRGKPELVLISGYSGAGKSAVVNELHKALVSSRALFAGGKFDQYKRDIPYATLAQAIQALIRQVLGKNEEETGQWRDAVREAVGSNGQLITSLVPDLVSLIGEQPPVPEVSPQDAVNRFNTVFRQLLGVFARPEHPLILYLDDLQWLDTATLGLLEHLLIHPAAKHLLVLGAYRDNEVSATHPLMLALDSIRKNEVDVHSIELGPLAANDVIQLTSDALHCEKKRAEPLASLIYEKTGGNPFFMIQFLTALAEEGLVTFDGHTASWQWDLDRIRAKGFTDNVADIVVGKLSRLREGTREGLKQLACLGNKARIATLALVQDATEDRVQHNLLEAICAGFIFQQQDTVSFLHDRVQEAAYALIPEAERAEVHLKTGRKLLSQMSPDDAAETLFDIVNHLNRGAGLMTDPAEKERLAELNAAAGKRARASVAYTTARNYFAAAAALLPEEEWDSRYEFQFALFLNWAECEYLCGAFDEAERLFDTVLAQAKNDLDKAAVYELRLQTYQGTGRFDDAITMATLALRLFGIEVPGDDEILKREIEAEAAAVPVNLKGRKIADLANAEEAACPRVKAIIGILSSATPSAYIGSRPQLYPYIVLKSVNLTLNFGPTKSSCHNYADYGLILTSGFGDPISGNAFLEMAITLSDRFKAFSSKGTILYLYGNHVNFWLNPLSTDFPLLERGFVVCTDSGNVASANYISYTIVWQAIERGDTLGDVIKFSRKFAEFSLGSRNTAVHQSICLIQQFAKCLTGNTNGELSFCDETVDELLCVKKVADAPFTCGVMYYHVMKLIAAYLMEDRDASRVHAGKAKKMLPSVMAMPMEATFSFFHALALARDCRDLEGPDRDESLKELAVYENKLAFWAKNCPANFACKHELVAAEIAGIRGDELLAGRLFEQAIESARASGFIHWEAMAHEAAARFHGSHGLKTASSAYLHEARDCYARWGAQTKVKQLDALHPWLAEEASATSGTIAARAEQLDVMTIIKAQHAISGEIVQDQLTETLLRIVMENAGAQKGYLSVEPGAELFAVAAAGRIEFSQTPSASFPSVAVSILNYVKRTRSAVFLADASSDAGDFSADEHLLRTKPKSVLCLPILRQAKLLGIVYLENNLAAGAFTPDRRAVLDMLASQAAISLETAQTYKALQESEIKYRRIVDTAREGIIGAGPDGVLTFCNTTITGMLGYDTDEILGRPLTDFAFEEDAADQLLMMEPRQQSSSECYERRFRHKDGHAVWTLVSSVPVFDEGGQYQGAFAMVTDITARKAAEAAQKQSYVLIEALLSHSPAGISVFDGETGKCVLANQTIAGLAGGSAEALQRQNFRQLPSWRAAGLDATAEEVLADGITRYRELILHTSFGKTIPLECTVSRFDVDGKPHLLFMGSDITERKKAEEQIDFLSRHDALTRLPNLLLVKDRLVQAMAMANSSRAKVALILLNLDAFKTVNDTLGHSAGDELLKTVAQRLSECVRDTDTLARHGGDEFLIMLPEIHGTGSVTGIVEKVLENLDAPFSIGGRELSISASIGVALYPDDGGTLDLLLTNADAALYSAKEAGRNTYRFFDRRMNTGTDERLQVRNQLRLALANGELLLHYQPQVDIASSAITGAEALIRWNNAELGMVMPGRFISIAEDSGLIVPIGEWVMREACCQAAAWRREGMPDLVVAVNLSAVQFRRGDIEQTVLAALAYSGLEPRFLELELTESMLIDDPETVLQTVHRLKALGVKLSIDDFGTGYSSLAYLKRFAVDKIKIDQSFVRNIDTDPNDDAIVRAIVQMARSLGLTTIAEGVENERQLAFLRNCQCDDVQGYHFGRPMPADRFASACRASHAMQ